MNLTQHNTLGLAARAERVARIDSVEALRAITSDLGNKPRFILGGGSNVVLHMPIPACVLINELKGKRIDEHGILAAASGENWHELVMWSLDQGYAGLENLALIPGTVGAAPVQNIGAYGVELADLLVDVTVWDFAAQDFKVFDARACGFGYRDSIFKHQDIQGQWNAPRYFITEVRMQLTVSSVAALNTSYGELQAELDRMYSSKAIAVNGSGQPACKEPSDSIGVNATPLDVAQAVIAIRRRKLPDPATLGNVGSFFKNPIVSSVQANALRLLHPEIPLYPVADSDGHVCKLPAAWLIERCGFKGARRGDVGVHEDHALVLVNYGGGTGREIIALANEIQQAVVARFGVFLEPEPVFVP